MHEAKSLLPSELVYWIKYIAIRHSVQVFENKVLQKMFLCKRGEQWKIKQGASQFCFLIYVIYIYMRMYCDDEKYWSQDFDRFTCFQVPLNLRKWFLEWCLYVCPSVCMNMRLSRPEHLGGDSLHIQYLSVYHRKLVHSEYGNSTSKKKGPLNSDSYEHSVYSSMKERVFFS